MSTAQVGTATLAVDPNSDIALGRQLVGQLRDAILQGALAAEDPLPPSRGLATKLGVSRGTVVAAYEQLIGEGYARSRQGSGTVVEHVLRDPTTTAGNPLAELAGPSGVRAVVGIHDQRGHGAGEGALNLVPGHPGTGRLIHREWVASVRTAAEGIAGPEGAREPERAGSAALRRAIADHLRRARGLGCLPEDIIVTGGTSDAVGLAALAVAAGTSGRRLRVACEDPGYPAVRAVLRRLGAEIVPVPVSEDGIDVDALEALSADSDPQGAGPVDAVMVTPSHQYPLGGRLPVASRIRLLDWARREDVVVIEDDYDSEFRHVGPPLPAMASLDPEGRVLHLSSFSKVLSPWLRCGYLVLPRKDRALRAELLAVREDLGTPVSGLVQAALADYLDSGGLRRHIARSARDYAHKRGLVERAFEGASPSITLAGLDGGLHAVLEFPDAAPAGVVVEALANRRIVVADLGRYAVTQSGHRNGIVIGYGAAGDLELAAALGVIRATIEAALR